MTRSATARALLVAHGMALVFGLGGMLIALPHPELWASDPVGRTVFNLGMQYAGPLHMVLGAAAMFAYGWTVLGWRRTTIFFVAACTLSLAAELIGTGTGYPFGNYEYTTGLGFKVLGRVPFSIPLSWFYMGLASYVLGLILTRGQAVWSVVLGAYLLTAWDLVLDPAMAHPGLPLVFWTWHTSGPYFGMPAQNFVGWTATGAVFMAVSRYFWRDGPEPNRLASSATYPLTLYALNLAWAMCLSAAGGLYLPIGLSLVLAGIGAALAARNFGQSRLTLRTA
ncbi:MAG: carotenoid biosynthesis protein [Chloroflexota bacterium]